MIGNGKSGDHHENKKARLTEFAFRNPLESRTAQYKIADRDGMHVAVSPAGTFPFFDTITCIIE